MKTLEEDADVLQRDIYMRGYEPDYSETVSPETMNRDTALYEHHNCTSPTEGDELEDINKIPIKKEPVSESSNHTSLMEPRSITIEMSQLSETINHNYKENSTESFVSSGSESKERVLTLPVPSVMLNPSDNYTSDLSWTSLSHEHDEVTLCSVEIESEEFHQNTSEADQQVIYSNHCNSLNRQNTSGTQPKPVQYLPPCRICGEKASGFHYGVNTCEACKGFFRRSIKRINQYKCVEFDGKCVIEPGRRNICPKCRFDKCLKVGMSKSAIKTGRYTHEKRSRDIREIKRLENTNGPMTEVVVNEDIEEAKKLVAILVEAQRKMYGPVNYEFWTSSDRIYKLAKEYQTQNKVKKDIFGDLNNLPEEEFNNFYKTTGIDIDNRIELMSEIATILENGVTRYINFVKTIPGFTALCLEDQAALIKVSRFEFWFIGYQRFICSSLGITITITQQCHDKSELSKVIGTEFMEELFYYSRKIQELNLTIDDIAVLRSFLVFSTDRCDLKDPEAVEKIQWKLLMCMKYLFELNHRPEERFLSKVLDRVASLRVISEMNEKRAETIKLEWPIMKNHPLLLELMSG